MTEEQLQSARRDRDGYDGSNEHFLRERCYEREALRRSGVLEGLSSLPERDQDFLRLLYGLDGLPHLTSSDAAYIVYGYSGSGMKLPSLIRRMLMAVYDERPTCDYCEPHPDDPPRLLWSDEGRGWIPEHPDRACDNCRRPRRL